MSLCDPAVKIIIGVHLINIVASRSVIGAARLDLLQLNLEIDRVDRSRTSIDARPSRVNELIASRSSRLTRVDRR